MTIFGSRIHIHEWTVTGPHWSRFSALLNLCVAPSAGPVTRGWAGGAAVLGSVLVLSGPVLLGIAFLEEPLDPSLDRSVTRLGVVACAAGTMLMTAGRWRRRRGRGRWPGARESDAA